MEETRAGRVHLQADLNQETGEAARVVLDAWSKPAPAAEGELDGAPASKDARPHQVRMHDAFGDVFKAVLNSGDLPACGGTPAAMVWHIKDTQYCATGTASRSPSTAPCSRSGTPCALPTRPPYVLIENSKGVPLYLGRTTRIATPGQTVALAARDRGCSFPGCDRPPSTANGTTSPTGPTADSPTSTTSPCSAATTTANTPNAAGSV